MVNAIQFLNSPIYTVGDILTERGDESFSSGSGAEYQSYEYYQYDNNSANEYYSIGEQAPNTTIRRESFHYYSDSSTGVLNDVSAHVTLQTFDSESREISEDNYSSMRYEWGEEERSSNRTYIYESPGSNKLISSTDTDASTYISYDDDQSNYSDARTEFITYTYDYSGMSDRDINSPHDYSTRWGTGSASFSNNEGVNESFTLYSKETRNPTRQGDSWQEMRVEINDQTGIITHTHISSDQYGNNNDSSSNINTHDWNGDGIIDSTNEHSYQYRNGTYSSMGIFKEDWDGDGLADYIHMYRESESRRGINRTEYTYNTDSLRPILEVKRIVDTNSDGIPESEVENAMFRTLTLRHTSMGGHAVSIEEVLA